MLLAAHWAYITEYDFTFCSFPLVIIHVIKASETILGLWKTGKNELCSSQTRTYFSTKQPNI